MSPITDPFVIILDEDLEKDLSQWSVVHKDKTLAAAKLHTQYLDVIHAYPRDRYQTEKLEVKNLVHTPSGVSKPGAIFRLSEVPARRGVLETRARFLKTGKANNILTREIHAIDSNADKKSPKRSIKTFMPIIKKKKHDTLMPVIVTKKDGTFMPIIVEKQDSSGGKKFVAPIIIRKVPRPPKKG